MACNVHQYGWRLEVVRWILVVLFVLLLAQPLAGQAGDSVRGQGVLREQGCLSCHALLGSGGSIAPDLGEPAGAVFSPATFAASVWNHAPEMWDAMARRDQEAPQLSNRDMRDLFAYLYSVRYFEPAGDAEVGVDVFRDKTCFRCHALVDTDAGGIGPSVSSWRAPSDFILFLEVMWNHGSRMDTERQRDGLMWPDFTTAEMADLLAYVYGLPDLPPTPARIQLGQSSAGMKVFDDLGCSSCHSPLDNDPDLLPFDRSERPHRTITDLAVAMWNHRPIMEEWAAGTGLPVRNFEEGQMGHLVSYLFEEGFLEERGSPSRGGALYTSKRCAQCHEDGSAQPLPQRSYTVMDVTAGIWRHGAEVRQSLADEGLRWPQVTANELADIVSWLNAR